jgi:hypothetical protein
MDAMFGNQGFQMPVDAPIPEIKIMRESAQFETPDGGYASEVVGTILHWHNANQYWETSFDERSPEDSPIPNCLSSDGIVPDMLDNAEYKQMSQTCKGCPMNEYGSDPKGEGKACQNTIRMYVLLDGEVVPCLLKAPPSSLGKKESLTPFLTNLPNVCTKHGTAYQCLRIKFSLYKKEFSSGMSASLIKMELVDVITDADAIKTLAGVTKTFREAYLGKVAQHMAKEADGVVDDDDKPI